MNNFKKGDIVYFLGNHINEKSIGTCYKEGDRVKIMEISTRASGIDRAEVIKLLLDNSYGVSQTVQLDQISYSLEKETDLGSVYSESEKTLNKLTEFPRFGWCPFPKKGFVDFLAKHFNADIVFPGKKGVAWNAHSYWPISNESSKPKFDYKQLKHFIEKNEKNEKTDDLNFSFEANISIQSKNITNKDDSYIEEEVKLLDESTVFNSLIKQKSKDINSGWVKEYIDRVPKASIYISKNKSTNKDLVISLLNIKDRKIK